MKALEYIIDKTGVIIYNNNPLSPTAIATANINGVYNSPNYNQITLIFYNAITTSSTGIVTPITPVLSGLTGTVTLQARSTDDSAWSDIQNGELDLSTGANMAFPTGVIRSINAICDSVAGCNYILIRLDRGA